MRDAKHTEFDDLVLKYCKENGLALSSLGLKALNDGRFFERRSRKIGDLAEKEAKVLAFINSKGQAA